MDTANFRLRRRPASRRNWRRHWPLLLLVALPVAHMIIFHYWPMYGIQIAFRQYVPSRGITGSNWVGLRYFLKFFTSYNFPTIIRNTLTITVYTLLTSTPLSIIFAMMINAVRSLRFKKFVQTVTYVPYFISVVVVVGMLYSIFNPVIGLYGNVYRLFGGVYPRDIIGEPKHFYHFYVWSGIWQNLGWNTIIYIAVLTSVDPELHEAAIIDGASRFRRIIALDWPTLLPTVSILLILNFGGMMNVGYEKVYLMQRTLNIQYSQVISTYVYEYGLKAGVSGFSYGTAIGLFNNVVNALLLVIVNTIARNINKESGASLW